MRISGGRGRPRPETLKVSVGVKEGWIGEGELTFTGLVALDRAKLAEAVVRERFRIGGVKIEELRVDYIGINSLHGDASLPRKTVREILGIVSVLIPRAAITPSIRLYEVPA